MIVDEDGVRMPRLRLKDVVRRGALFGVGAAAVLTVGMLFIADHHDREEFLSVVGGISLFFALGLLVFGALLWAISGGDVRRWRDVKTITGQNGAQFIMAPTCVRLGMAGLVFAPVAIGLYNLVDQAASDSWLYGW
ncbi:DUF6336 family protein [Streptomyces sp. NPDC001536]|uniref:DUF6336 family protein n=1 Tax=Streptomyces sp. NPDC001536 TaxID=3364583 RepID=UPI00367A3AEB